MIMGECKKSELGIVLAHWKIKLVEDLMKEGIIEKPLDGNHGNIHPKSNDFVNSGIPFVMASDINNGQSDLVNCKFIDRNHADSLINYYFLNVAI